MNCLAAGAPTGDGSRHLGRFFLMARASHQKLRSSCLARLHSKRVSRTQTNLESQPAWIAGNSLASALGRAPAAPPPPRPRLASGKGRSDGRMVEMTGAWAFATQSPWWPMIQIRSTGVGMCSFLTISFGFGAPHRSSGARSIPYYRVSRPRHFCFTGVALGFGAHVRSVVRQTS